MYPGALLLPSEEYDGLDYATFEWDDRMCRSLFLTGLVMLLYDYLLILAAEVQYVWSSKLRRSTCGYYTVRYLGLTANIAMSVYYLGDLSHERYYHPDSTLSFNMTKCTYSCLRMWLVWEVLLIIQEMMIECVLILRVFAMYDLNFPILVCLLAINVLAGSLALWAAIKDGFPQMLAAPELPGCHILVQNVQLHSGHRLGIAWEVVLLCDMLVFALTVRRAYIQRRSCLRYKGTLMEMMVTDGAMYFGIMVLTNLANVVTLYLGDVLLSGFVSWFSTSLSMALLSRLMLHLYEAASDGMDSLTMDFDSIRFARTATTIAEPQEDP
ncbi:hypothetical protein C8R47DRAFT_1219086 [Mycena vitilis]|nr:hypothetical protein C8R47DRAFT_1219086 [Mycena vitilis]